MLDVKPIPDPQNRIFTIGSKESNLGTVIHTRIAYKTTAH